MTPLLSWLKENIHQYGQFYSAKKVCKKATGEKLNLKYFVDYSTKKYDEVYNIKE